VVVQYEGYYEKNNKGTVLDKMFDSVNQRIISGAIYLTQIAVLTTQCQISG
jgi:hypothetical protein